MKIFVKSKLKIVSQIVLERKSQPLLLNIRFSSVLNFESGYKEAKVNEKERKEEGRSKRREKRKKTRLNLTFEFLFKF